jgi:hypothetical protein
MQDTSSGGRLPGWKSPRGRACYDVTSSYLEGECNGLGEFGYDRDGKRGKLQIVIGLLTDAEGEPLAVRVFKGNTGDPTTIADQVKIIKEQFQVQELVFVGDRGMVKSQGKQALAQAGLRYITALTDPQIRGLLGTGTLPLGLFHEQICEVEGDGGALRTSQEQCRSRARAAPLGRQTGEVAKKDRHAQ